MMAGPWENRDLSLEYFQLDFLGQYTVKHAFINGINIDRCYPGAPPDHVQVVMMSFRDGSRSPGIIVMGRGHPPAHAVKLPPSSATRNRIPTMNNFRWATVFFRSWITRLIACRRH